MVEASTSIVKELAPTGVVRAAINLGNIVLAQQEQQESSTGTLRGVSVDLTWALAARLGVKAELFPFDTASRAFAALRAGSCDVGFLAIDPARAVDLIFTPPYVIIEGTYLVAHASPLRTIDDLDRQGVRIAAGQNTAYDLHLTRNLKNATLVHAPSSLAAIELLLEGRADAAAGVRQPLVATAAAKSGFRVLDGGFMAIEQAMALPNGRPEAARFLKAFIEDMKASGFVAAALKASGQGEAEVAPPHLG